MQSDTQNESQPIKNEVVETRIKPAFPLISNQPERFGLLSQVFLFIEERRLYEILGKIRFWTIVTISVLSVPIIIDVYARLTAGAPPAGTVMDVAKILIVYVLIGSVLALSVFFFYRHKIMEVLAQLEDLAYFGDDMARFYMPYVRSELKDFNAKVRKHKEEPDMPNSMEIMRDLWPVISLLLKRDANILKWGKVGMRAYKAFSVFFKGHPNNSSSEST